MTSGMIFFRSILSRSGHLNGSNNSYAARLMVGTQLQSHQLVFSISSLEGRWLGKFTGLCGVPIWFIEAELRW